MKIALVEDYAAEGWPSMALYAEQLAVHLAALPSPRSPVEIVRVQPRRPLPRLAGRVGNWITLLSRWTVYPAIARRVRADVYHVLDHSYANLIPDLPRNRTVVTCHDLAPLAMGEAGDDRSCRPYSPTLWAWRRAVSHLPDAAHVIAGSQNTRADLARFLNIPSERISVVYYGVESSFSPELRARRDETRARFHLPAEAPLVIHVGACAPRKNVSAILRAVAQVRRRIPVRFLQVGGQFRAEERAIIREESLAHCVTQLPFVAREDLPALYAAADALAFPSFYEGFGLPPLEAMACGTPVVCSNAASLPEVVGEAALLVEARDSQGLAARLTQVLADPTLAGSLRARGIARARQFNWQQVARQTMAVYQKVAETIR